MSGVGAGQRSRSLVLTKRITASGDENGSSDKGRSYIINNNNNDNDNNNDGDDNNNNNTSI